MTRNDDLKQRGSHTSTFVRYCLCPLFLAIILIMLSCTAAWAQSTVPAALSGANTIGVFRPSTNPDGSPGLASWWVDSNGNHAAEGSDSVYWFGLGGDIPVVGDWQGNGTLRLGVFRNGYWYVDWDGSHVWDDVNAQHIFAFGLPFDYPIVADWTHTGKLRLGVFRPSEGAIYADISGCNCFDINTYARYQIYNNGQPLAASGVGYIPVAVAGNWSQGSALYLALFLNGSWYLDTSGTNSFDLATAPKYTFGLPGDLPTVGYWTGNGSWTGFGALNIGVYRGSQTLWYLDLGGYHIWASPPDATYSYGLNGDTPVTGPWFPAPPPPATTVTITDNNNNPPPFVALSGAALISTHS